MRKSPRHVDAINYLVASIAVNRGSIDANLQLIDSTVRPLTILPFFTLNVSNDEFPLLMFEQTGKTRDWEALDTGGGPTYRVRFESTLWGLVAGYEDRVMDLLADELEASVSDILNTRHESFVYRGWEFFFNEIMPMENSTYGITKIGPALARGFTSSIVVDAILSAPQAPGT